MLLFEKDRIQAAPESYYKLTSELLLRAAHTGVKRVA